MENVARREARGLPSASARARLLIVSGDRFFRAGRGTLRLLAGALAALAAMSAAGAGRVPEAKAPAELENAYPVEIRASGVVREFTIRAAPTRLPLIGLESVDVWAYNGQVPGPTLAHAAGRDAAGPLPQRPAAADDDPLARRARAERHGWRARRDAAADPAGRRASSTSSRRRTPARSGSIRTCARASRSSAGSSAC